MVRRLDGELLVRGAAAATLAAALLVAPLAAPAGAFPYGGGAQVDGDRVLANVDVLTGDLTVTGTLTVPSGVTVFVRAPGTVTITADRIVIDGVLDGTGGGGAGGTAGQPAGGTGPGGAGTSAIGGCGGGGGAGSAGAGGAGGAGGAVAGGLAGPAYSAGPGSGGGAGGACGPNAGAAGGAGGAGIHLVASSIAISGSVRADGENGASGVSGGGGGSGGEIRLSGPTVLSGTLRAVGGNGGAASGRDAGGGGGGSGGRISVDAGSSLIGLGDWSVTVNQATSTVGGTGGVNGTPGAPGGLGVEPTVTTPASTSTSVSSSVNPSAPGQSVAFTATVTPPDAAGTVAFADGGTPISGCDAVPVVSGTAGCVTDALATGEHTITATFQPIGPAYGASAGTVGQTVQEPAQIEQVVAFDPPADHLVGEPPFTVSGVTGGSSGNPVTFTASGPCAVTGTTVSLTGVGTCTLTADQAGGGGYAPATSVTHGFAISYDQRVVSLSASGRRGGVVAVVLRLTAADGGNLSSAAVPVHATAIDGVPLDSVFTGDPAPDFRYVPLLGSYVFGAYLREGLSRGPHVLTFTAGADPRPHSVPFTTR